MHPAWRDLRGGFEGKASRMEARVWKLQRRTTAHHAICEEEIEIQRPGPKPLLPRPIPTGRPFELLTTGVEMTGPCRPLDHSSCIEEVGLGRTDRAGAPQPRYGHDPPIPCQCGQTTRKQPLRVADIAAEAEGDANHQLG